MSRSKNDQRGKRINGEITGRLGQVMIAEDGYFARSHNDNVGSPIRKKEAKRAVVRARRRIMNKVKSNDLAS